MDGFTLGIDLGTTNSCVAVYRNEQVTIIENEQGHRVTPSWVTFTETGVLTGPESVDAAHLHIKTTVFESKRLIGQEFKDPKVQEDVRRFPYKVFNDLGTPKIRIELDDGETKEFYPEEVSAHILSRMKLIAEKRLNATVTRAVITVPAYFNDAQRQATKDAAAIAGFKTANVINEPTAAAIAFNHQNKKPYKRNIVVYDFGGGTFDVSVVTVSNGRYDVKSTKGDCHLGGTDIDMVLVQYISEEFKKKYNRDIVSDEASRRRLKNACEKTKKKLSGLFSVNVELDLFSGLDYSTFPITRARFELLNADLFNETLKILDVCIKESGLSLDAIDAAVLVGGSSRIPKIQEMLTEYFGADKINKGVNPDEAVAYGAAIHATNLAGDKNEVNDVTSLSLGTNTYGDLMSVIIPRNTPIPAKCIKRYQTIADNQTTMEFPIYQGEREIASENYELGNFTMTDLTEADAKTVKVEVCYRIDGEGLLHISATEINANNKKDVDIDVKKRGLSEEQIKARIKDAEMYKEKDAQRIKFYNERYSLELALYEMKTYVEKNNVENAQTILEAYEDISRWLENTKIEDVDEIIKKKQHIKDLTTPPSASV